MEYAPPCVLVLDEAGNKDTEPHEITFMVDRTPPVTTFKESLQKFYTKNSILVEWETVDATQVTYEYQLDAEVGSSRWTSVGHDDALMLSNIGEGPHAICVRATDQAGNVEAKPPRHYFEVRSNIAAWPVPVIISGTPKVTTIRY
eukprot:scaffold1664_cov351-Prasinococcus_capsulatus_cf.AAC.7